MKGFPEVRVYDPTQLIECEVGGVWYEFERVKSATDAVLARVLLGVFTLEGDGDIIRSHSLDLWRETMALDTVRIVPYVGPYPIDWLPVFDMRPGRVVVLYDVGGPMWRVSYMNPWEVS